MDFTLIPDWNKKNLRCHFCGETKSVKYTTKTTFLPNGILLREVYVCNKCALRAMINQCNEKNEERTNLFLF